MTTRTAYAAQVNRTHRDFFIKITTATSGNGMHRKKNGTCFYSSFGRMEAAYRALLASGQYGWWELELIGTNRETGYTETLGR